MKCFVPVAALFLVYGILWGVFANLYPVCGDDYLFFNDAASHGVWGAVCSLFMNWSCRLGSVMMFLLCRYGGHGLFAWLTPVIQIVTVFLLVKLVLLRRFNGRNGSDLWLLAGLLGSIVFVARPRDTVYWMAGATGYSWSAVIVLSFFALLWEWRQERSWMKAVMLFLSGLLAGYCNENVFVTGVFVLPVWLYFHRQIPMAAGALGFLGGGALLFLNPGFAVRAAAAGVGTQGNFVMAVARRLPEALLFWGAAVWVPLLVAGIAGTLLFFLKPDGWNRKEVWLKAAVWWGLSLVSALVFAGGPLPAMRAYYFSSLLAIGGSAVLLYHLLSLLPRLGKIVAVFLCVAGISVMVSALPDLWKIHEDDAERTRLVEAARRQYGVRAEVAVPEHRVLRQHFFQYIFMEDLNRDPRFWLNTGAARYYGIKTIAVEERGPRPAIYRDKLFPPSRPQGGVTPVSDRLKNHLLLSVRNYEILKEEKKK